MSKKIKVLAMLMGLIMTLSLVGCSGKSGTSAAGEVKVGDEAPEFYANLTNGKSFVLSENKGKVVLINFWATWCGPCVEELPAIEKLQKEYGDKIEIVAVNYGEDKKTVKVVLINFWATWCGPCVEELPAIEKLQKEYGDKIEIVAVNYGEDKKTVDEFLKDKNYTFKVAYEVRIKRL